jgi:alpha-ketoglutarate-dependent taurine dioxygenase
VIRYTGHTLPLLVEPSRGAPGLAPDAPDAPDAPAAGELRQLVQLRRDELLEQLHRHGALLFRGFAIEDVHAFEQVVRGFAPSLRNYQGGDSPRDAVTDKIYTSTSYPASLPIPLHNEMSYTRAYPSLIAFYCHTPPASEGETPLADCRRILDSLSAETRARFQSKKLCYLQNLPDGAGLGKSWQATFETEDRHEVEAILRARGAEHRWKPDGSLRISEVIDPIVVHPTTGEAVFFSQAHLWHASSLDPRTRRALTRLVAEEDLYHHCTFGDGTPLGEDDLLEVRRATAAATVAFPWQRHDLLLVDNVLVAHGRNRFSGERRILVAMA